MKTTEEYRRKAIELKHQLSRMRKTAMDMATRANAAHAKLSQLGILAAGMRVGGSVDMADAIDEILDLKPVAKR